MVGLIILCLLTSSALGAFVPKLIADLSRNYAIEADYFSSMLALFFIFLGVYLNRVLYQLGVNVYIRELIQEVRTFCYSKWLLHYDLQTSKKSESERYPQGEVLARIMSDTEAVRELITSGTFGIFIDLFFVISCLISFITMNTTSGLILTAAQVIVSVLLLWGSGYMRKIFLSVRKSSGQVSKTVANIVGGVKETYYTRHEHYASKKGEIVFEDFLKKQLTSNIWDASYYSVAESLYPLFLALIVLIFPYSKITEAAVILAIVDLIQRSINPIKDMAGKIANVQRAVTGFQRIAEFVGDLGQGHFSSMDMKSQTLEVEELHVRLEHFAYPIRKGEDGGFALKKINFKVHRGELVGIVGLSGCGKSTLLNIIAGNIIPDDGEIELLTKGKTGIHFPGRGTKEENFAHVIRYREQVGIVSQDSHIFSESLIFNICLTPDKPADFDEFWIWLKERLPYLSTWKIQPETVLDQKTLSVGQKQLLAAIRSCYLKKSIVLFDEIASGLDSELEMSLRKIVLYVQQHALTFIVAHRLETIVEADKILVLHQGELVAEGNHQTLLDQSSAYQEFIAEMSPSEFN